MIFQTFIAFLQIDIDKITPAIAEDEKKINDDIVYSFQFTIEQLLFKRILKELFEGVIDICKDCIEKENTTFENYLHLTVVEWTRRCVRHAPERSTNQFSNLQHEVKNRVEKYYLKKMVEFAHKNKIVLNYDLNTHFYIKP